ncbi:MAG: hypothetical protein GXP34_06065 [Actinobacteria bacterium]|nr:hypothetical protein [Actinomycetota bacterium]
MGSLHGPSGIGNTARISGVMVGENSTVSSTRSDHTWALIPDSQDRFAITSTLGSCRRQRGKLGARAAREVEEIDAPTHPSLPIPRGGSHGVNESVRVRTNDVVSEFDKLAIGLAQFPRSGHRRPS